MTDSNQRQEQLQCCIDGLLLSSHTAEWSAHLPFHVERVVGPNNNTILAKSGCCPDILKYLGSEFRGCKVYFPTTLYNPSNGFSTLGARTVTPTDWDRLRVDLSRATMQNGGYHLISNGYTLPNSRKLLCQHGRCYQKNRSYNGPGRQPDAGGLYRKSSFVDDRRKNSRGPNGTKMARRTKTGRQVTRDSLCQFRLTIKRDDTGFYLHNTGRSPPKHRSHPQLDANQVPTQSRLLPTEVLDTIHALNSVNACTGIGRDVALKKYNTVMSLQQLRYLQGFSSPSFEEGIDNGGYHGKVTPILMEALRNVEATLNAIEFEGVAYLWATLFHAMRKHTNVEKHRMVDGGLTDS